MNRYLRLAKYIIAAVPRFRMNAAICGNRPLDGITLLIRLKSSVSDS